MPIFGKKMNFYAIIRYCNIFFEEIDGVFNMPDDEKALWVAELKALKAQIYFELMRRYGPIVLVPENIAVNSEIEMMQQPRAPIDTCVNAIVKLLDEAMEVLPAFRQKINPVGHITTRICRNIKSTSFIICSVSSF